MVMSNLPNHLKFTKTHEWLSESQGEVTIGITEHAQHLLGDLVFVDLPEIGQQVSAGDDLGVVESVKAASDFYAPISGQVTAVNQLVNENPALVNQAPYDAGWLVKMKADNPDDIRHLLDASVYQQEIAEDE